MGTPNVLFEEVLETKYVSKCLIFRRLLKKPVLFLEALEIILGIPSVLLGKTFETISEAAGVLFFEHFKRFSRTLSVLFFKALESISEAPSVFFFEGFEKISRSSSV